MVPGNVGLAAPVPVPSVQATSAPATSAPATSVPTRWRKRTNTQGAQQDLSPEEKAILSDTTRHYSGGVETSYKFVKDFMELLRNWPEIFTTRELCGERLHAALLNVASHLLVLSALLASVSITPLISALPGNVDDWKQRTHGALWSLVLSLNFATLGAAALFLFHLLGCPPQLGWVWACNMGAFLITIPLALMSVSAVMSFVAVSFTCWFIYGRIVGVLTTVVSVIFVLFGGCLALRIGQRHLKTLNIDR